MRRYTLEGVKWIFPTAATIPITLNGGMKMTGWYDINDLSVDRIVDDREQTMQVGDVQATIRSSLPRVGICTTTLER